MERSLALCLHNTEGAQRICRRIERVLQLSVYFLEGSNHQGDITELGRKFLMRLQQFVRNLQTGCAFGVSHGICFAMCDWFLQYSSFRHGHHSRHGSGGSLASFCFVRCACLCC